MLSRGGCSLHRKSIDVLELHVGLVLVYMELGLVFLWLTGRNQERVEPSQCLFVYYTEDDIGLLVHHMSKAVGVLDSVPSAQKDPGDLGRPAYHTVRPLYKCWVS